MARKSKILFVSGAGGNAGTSILEKKLFQKRRELLWYFLSGLSLILFVSQQGLQAPAETWAALCPMSYGNAHEERKLLSTYNPGDQTSKFYAWLCHSAS